MVLDSARIRSLRKMNMRALVVANWKMNPPTFREAKKLFEATRKAAEKARKSNVVIAPPAVFLRELSKRYRGSRVAFAVQNAHWEAGGAHTGEISLRQAHDARAHYAIIGHAERRAEGETDDDVRKKVASALALKMTPILCVGEKERTDGGDQYGVVREQLRAALADVAPAKLGGVLVVYEPLWSVGKDTTMDPREMHQMAIFMRKCIVDTHGDAGRSLKILYGGSVDEKNAGAMLREAEVRGFLVGRASIDAKGFSALLKVIENA